MAIKQATTRLKTKYQTEDPYDICGYMDIQVMKRPMGSSARSCKGFFLCSTRCKMIVINSDLPDSIQRIIIAHELGHAVLHSDSAISAFHEFSMFDDTDRMEYEANVFAAEFTYTQEHMEDVEFSYCTTIHKSQGQEYPVIIVPLLKEHYIMLRRNLLYTAVTRAKAKVILIGQKQAVFIAIHKCDVGQRNTVLADRIVAYYEREIKKSA